MKRGTEKLMRPECSPAKPRHTAAIEPGRRGTLSSRYTVRLATTQKEIESALRLRYDVFNVELAGQSPRDDILRLEYDKFDFACRHLIVVDEQTGETVGTYRLNSLETAGAASGFYSYGEFSIEDLPEAVLEKSIEIGRACIAREHRNTKVLFLLWKGLADYLRKTEKRYLFGCCSIFTTDHSEGWDVFRKLMRDGFLHQSLTVRPRAEKICRQDGVADIDDHLELPQLFKMYLAIGAKICGAPVVDPEFGTIDYFVVCDVENINEKYRRLLLG